MPVQAEKLRQHGSKADANDFSLIELLIVVAIILTIAAYMLVCCTTLNTVPTPTPASSQAHAHEAQQPRGVHVVALPWRALAPATLAKMKISNTHRPAQGGGVETGGCIQLPRRRVDLAMNVAQDAAGTDHAPPGSVAVSPFV